MAFVATTFKLDLTPGASRPVIYASAGDVGRPFTASLYWNGEAWSASGTTANIRGKKPDDTVFDYTATVSGSSVTFSTTEQMTIIPGPVECELVFSQGGDVIASANFVLIVEESPYDPDALSESVIPGIVDLIEDTIGGDVRDEVQAELEAHPEWTTTVQDGAITESKINSSFLPSIKNAYVTPEMFGAKGDGETDDLTAINQCFTAASAQNKAVLFGSVYAVSAMVSVPRFVNILGYGYQYSGLKLIEVADAVLLCSGYSTIEGVTIDGNNMATYAVRISNPYTNIEKCLIKGGDKSAIVFRTTYCNVIHNNRIYGGEYAVICNFNDLTSVARHNATTISDNIIINASKYAFVIGGGDSWRIENNTIELCRLGVAVFTCFRNLKFTGNYLENNGKYSSVFTMANTTFYIRPIIVFNSFDDGNMALAAGTVGQSAVVSNNFVNMSDVASDNSLPSNYSDLSTFIIASGIENLTINNNTCISSGSKNLIMYGSRSANTKFDKCHVFNNKGFDNIKRIGGNYTGLTVAPDIYADNVVQYNYFDEYDFSDFTGLTFTDTNASLYGNKIYSCDVSNTYGNFYASYDILKPLKGKTVIIGFWANVPEGVTIGFYSNAGIPFNEECIIKNSIFNEWTFVGMSLEVPETFSTNFRFYVQMHGITTTPVQVAGLFLAEIGTPKNTNTK